MKKPDILLALNLIPHIESRSIFAILDYVNSIKDVLVMPKTKLLSLPGIGLSTAEKILTFPFEKRLEQEKVLAEKNKVTIFINGAEAG